MKKFRVTRMLIDELIVEANSEDEAADIAREAPEWDVMDCVEFSVEEVIE